MEAAYSSRVLAEIDPHSEWDRGNEFDTLIVDVSGFTKDQLKVQVDPSGSLQISGERAVNGGQQWYQYHFLKRFDFPGGCVDAAAIKVQLDKGVLYVQVPHPSAPADVGGSEQHPTEAPADVGGSEQHPTEAAADVGGSEQHPTEAYVDALQEEETTGAVWSGRAAAQTRDGHPASQLAKSLSKHRQAVLNVVLAVVLLWLIAFTKNKLNVVLAVVLLWLVAFAINKPGGGQVKNE